MTTDDTYNLEFCGTEALSLWMEKEITSFPLAIATQTYYGFTMNIVATLWRNLVYIIYFPSINTYDYLEFSVPESNYFIRDFK